MSKQKLTPWFPADELPSRDGVYEMRGGGWAKYERGRWFFVCDTADKAAREVSTSIWPTPASGRGEGDNSMDWRGLASQPKDSAPRG